MKRETPLTSEIWSDPRDFKTSLAEAARAVETVMDQLIPVPDGPDWPLIAALARLGRPVFAEGRLRTPAQAQAAIQAGASAVVVGSAITRIEHITAWFVEAIAKA